MNNIPNELSCAICIQLFEQPISLPCKHAFCKTCIVESLTNKSECPICRRVFCLPIDEELEVDKVLQNHVETFKETNDEQALNMSPQSFKQPTQWWDNPTTKEGIPVFGYEITTPMNCVCSFNFFEPRYVCMVTACMKTNLLFAIHGGQKLNGEKVCNIVEIIHANQYQTDEKSIYQCTVRNIGRAKMTHDQLLEKDFGDQHYVFLAFRCFKKKNQPLSYTIPERIVDKIDGLSEEQKSQIIQLMIEIFLIINQIESKSVGLPKMIMAHILQKLPQTIALNKIFEKKVAEQQIVLDKKLAEEEAELKELAQEEAKEYARREALNKAKADIEQEEQINSPLSKGESQESADWQDVDQEDPLELVLEQLEYQSLNQFAQESVPLLPSQQQEIVAEVLSSEVQLNTHAEKIQEEIQHDQNTHNQQIQQQDIKLEKNQNQDQNLQKVNLQSEQAELVNQKQENQEDEIQQKVIGQEDNKLQDNQQKEQDDNKQDVNKKEVIKQEGKINEENKQEEIKQEEEQFYPLDDPPEEEVIQQQVHIVQQQEEKKEVEVKIQIELEPAPEIILTAVDLEKISQFSLQFISFLNIQKGKYYKVYFGTDLKERLTELKVQMEAFLVDNSIYHFKIMELFEQQ